MNNFFDEEASEVEEASDVDVSGSEEEEFLVPSQMEDGESEEIQSEMSDEVEDNSEEEEDEEEEDEIEEEHRTSHQESDEDSDKLESQHRRRSSSKKKNKKKKKKKKKKKRRLPASDDSSDSESGGELGFDDQEDDDARPAKRHPSLKEKQRSSSTKDRMRAPRKHEKRDRRRRSKVKKSKPERTKRSRSAGSSGKTATKSSSSERPSSKKRKVIESPRKAKAASDEAKRLPLHGKASKATAGAPSPSSSPSPSKKKMKKATKKNQGERTDVVKTHGSHIQALKKEISASSEPHILFKGKRKGAAHADSPEGEGSIEFQVLLQRKPHAVVVPSNLVRERKVMGKNSLVRFDGHTLTTPQIYNFVSNLKFEQLISPDDCRIFRPTKRKTNGNKGTEKMQFLSKSFFLVVPHFSKEDEPMLFVVSPPLIRLALLWRCCEMLDLCAAGKKERAVEQGELMTRITPSLDMFNARWEQVLQLLHQAAFEKPERGEKLEPLLALFEASQEQPSDNKMEGLRGRKAAALAERHEDEGEVKGASNQAQATRVPPTEENSALVDVIKKSFSQVVDQHKSLDTSLQSILGVLREISDGLGKKAARDKAQLDQTQQGLVQILEGLHDPVISNGLEKTQKEPKRPGSSGKESAGGKATASVPSDSFSAMNDAHPPIAEGKGATASSVVKTSPAPSPCAQSSSNTVSNMLEQIETPGSES